MATQGERLDALEKNLAELIAKIDEFETSFATRFAEIENALAEDTAKLIDGDLVAGYSPRDDILKAHRQIEAIANHINVRLPA